MRCFYASTLLLVTMTLMRYDVTAAAETDQVQGQRGGGVEKVGKQLPSNLLTALCNIKRSFFRQYNKNNFCQNNKDVRGMCNAVCNTLKTRLNQCATIDGKPPIPSCICLNDPNADPSQFYFITTANITKPSQTCRNNDFKVVVL